MSSVSAAVLSILGTAGILFAFGYLIRVRGWVGLVAGYDESTQIPDEVLAKIVGNTFLWLGAATVVWGVLEAAGPLPESAGLVYALVVCLAVGQLLYRLHTYPTDTTADRA